MKKLLVSSLLAASLLSPLVMAEEYIVDHKGAHASVNFKIKHLGYSWLTGRFDTFSGQLSYDAKNPSAAKIEMTVDTTSVNSNHAERDKHLRSDDFLDVDKFSNAKFVSSSVTDKGDNKLEVKGLLSLHGVEKEIMIDVEKIGEGKDPWGGYRVGFSGTSTISLQDFGIKVMGSSSHAELTMHIEAIKK